MNLQNINKNWLLLGGAIVLGGAAVFLSNKAIQNKMAELEAESARGSEMVSVVVPIRDLAKGEVLTPELVAARKIPKQYAHSSALTPQRFGDVRNERLAVPIKRGEALLESHIDGMGNRVFSTILSKGMRALTTEVDDISSISGMLRPGDHIDLIFRVKDESDPKAPDVIFPLMSNVTVLATGQSITKKTEEGQDKSFSTVTLEVLPVDADRILLAKSAGTLTAVLRHPDDLALNNTPRLNMANLMSGGKKLKDRFIEYVIGGGGAPGGVTLVNASTQSQAMEPPVKVNANGVSQTLRGASERLQASVAATAASK